MVAVATYTWGNGALTVKLTPWRPAPFHSIGKLTIAFGQRYPSTGTFHAVGAFTATAFPTAPVAAAFHAIGVLSAPTGAKFASAAPFHSKGVLTAGLSLKGTIVKTAALGGKGALTAVVAQKVLLLAPMSGPKALLTAATSFTTARAAALAGKGVLSAKVANVSTPTGYDGFESPMRWYYGYNPPLPVLFTGAYQTRQTGVGGARGLGNNFASIQRSLNSPVAAMTKAYNDSLTRAAAFYVVTTEQYEDSGPDTLVRLPGLAGKGALTIAWAPKNNSAAALSGRGVLTMTFALKFSSAAAFHSKGPLTAGLSVLNGKLPAAPAFHSKGGLTATAGR